MWFGRARAIARIFSRRGEPGEPGKRWNFVPSPSSLATRSPPRAVFTNSATLGRPVPDAFVVEKGSKTWGRASAGMPQPSSRAIRRTYRLGRASTASSKPRSLEPAARPRRRATRSAHAKAWSCAAARSVSATTSSSATGTSDCVGMFPDSLGDDSEKRLRLNDVVGPAIRLQCCRSFPSSLEWKFPGCRRTCPEPDSRFSSGFSFSR